MFSYFIPISLLVVAAFTLGVLVGRLAWASSMSSGERESNKAIIPNRPQETASNGAEDAGQPAPISSVQSSQQSATDLPTWQMREISSSEQKAEVG